MQVYEVNCACKSPIITRVIDCNTDEPHAIGLMEIYKTAAKVESTSTERVPTVKFLPVCPFTIRCITTT